MKLTISIIILVLSLGCNSNAQEANNQKTYPVSKTEAQWKSELTAAEFQVLRKKGTERAFSSPLNRIEQPGTFVCAACGNELYQTRHKFESGTGWPSFDRPADEKNVDYRPDRTGALVLWKWCAPIAADIWAMCLMTAPEIPPEKDIVSMGSPWILFRRNNPNKVYQLFKRATPP
ncbi:peptide-methionine (R)-S-oxide reductase [Salinimicrobium tongyeongense]|uniref:peptide-methionine (R)-S-oxide reductase n=1 Tax=Salinimicrobium tongyeongense TaxID=2809707 RepID=UPI003FCD0559